MPELPEVEVVKNELVKKITNLKITNVKVNLIKSLKNIVSKELAKKLINQKVISISRKGKYLILETNMYYLVFHLRMEGKFFIEKNDIDRNISHNVLWIEFDNKQKLYFDDFRKFATINFFEMNSDEYNLFFKKLGPEPENVDINLMIKQFKNLRSPIKTTLLNQSYISGLGNIYVDEVLYQCKILPIRKTNEVTKKELICIIKESEKIFIKSINYGGTTIKTFNSFSKIGEYQKFLKVHLQKGKKCGISGVVKKIKVNGRGTYYCEGVQK